MSVINKMLRDLDQRQAGSAGASMPGERVALGTLPVTALPRLKKQAGSPRVIWLALLVAAGVVGGWYWQSGQRSAALQATADAVQVAQASASGPARAPSNVVSADAAAIQRPAAALSAPPELPASSLAKASKHPTSVPAESKTAVKSVETKPTMPREPLPKLLTPSKSSSVAAATDMATGSLRMESSLTRLPAPSSAPKNGVPQAATGRSAPLEALAQAQSLWNSGGHAAATELLAQALSRIEGAAPSGMPVVGQSPLASVVRELARMHLAEGQVNQALVLLKRLEPQLAQVADVWAMRGNAAQRLGQHAEAAQSYLKALALKPDEPRWMLGAAVSLAAQGQIAAAGELAEKARGIGALRPDVANYLRQLGVVIRTD